MSFAELIKNKTVLVPGVFDPLSALMAYRAGFNVLYLSGASISYTYLGLPDLSFTNLSDVENVLRRIKARVDAYVICDADNGYGNEDNVAHTIKVLEKSGASAIQLEDQDSPKKCGHLPGKKVIPREEMILKLRAALKARDKALIIARTDSLTVNGIDDAIQRANSYIEEGADIAFVESPRTKEEIERISKEVHGPKLINMVEGGITPIIELKDLIRMKFNIVIYPGSAVRAISFALMQLYSTMMKDGTTKAFSDRMFTFSELQSILR
ncbi:MAG: oxaloacetate decarboxylase [Thermoplasmatales archaeon]